MKSAILKFSKEERIKLVCDAGAAWDYSEISKGEGLENAYESILPLVVWGVPLQPEDGETPADLSKLSLPKFDRRVVMDLAWAMTASHRDETDHEHPADPRKCPIYRKIRRMDYAQLRELSVTVVRMLIAALRSPTEPDPSTPATDTGSPAEPIGTTCTTGTAAATEAP